MKTYKCIQCSKQGKYNEKKLVGLRPKPKWCSLKCKADTYMECYAGSALVKELESKHIKQEKLRFVKLNLELNDYRSKNPGKDICDWLRSKVKKK